MPPGAFRREAPWTRVQGRPLIRPRPTRHPKPRTPISLSCVPIIPNSQASLPVITDQTSSGVPSKRSHATKNSQPRAFQRRWSVDPLLRRRLSVVDWNEFSRALPITLSPRLYQSRTGGIHHPSLMMSSPANCIPC